MSKTKGVTAEEIIESQKVHGDDFLILDIFPETIKGKKVDKLRTNKTGTVQYGNVLIKKPDGTKVPLIIKFIQLTTNGNIKKPNFRDYETIKLAFLKDDKVNTESKFGEAIDIICKTFERLVESYVKEGKISTKPKKNTLRVHSSSPAFPVQYTAIERETGEVVELENPLMWFELQQKYYSQEEQDELEHFEGLTYQRDDTKPILVKEFTVAIKDLKKRTEEKRVKVNRIIGEKVILKKTIIPPATDEEGNSMNTCNVQKFITAGSIVSGYVVMGLTISKSAFNLKTVFKNKLYVAANDDDTANSNEDLDPQDVEEMIPDVSKLSLLNKSVEG